MAWCLVANTGMLHILQQDLMLIGRHNCDISIQSRTVDKHHSVIAYDKQEGTHSIKDVGSLNGTFVNESRIPEQTYISLKKGDSIRFGYDPITYRFDSLQLDNISVVKDQEGFIKQAFLSRHNPPTYPHQSVRRAMQERDAKESRNSQPSYSKQNNFQDQRAPSHGSPLYGQPAWWGEHDDQSPDGSSSPDHLRHRANTASTQGSSDDNHHHINSSPFERPTRLHSQEPERDIPVVIYDQQRRPTPISNAATNRTQEESVEIKHMASSEKAIGFTIDFGGSTDAPKMARRPDSLQSCIPANVREKIEKSTRMMEELKAERLMKKSLEEDAALQSPRASPLSSRTDAWTAGGGGGGGGGGRRTPKQGTPETPSPGYQADVGFQQQQRKNKSSNCLSEPLPPAHIRQRTFVKSSQKSSKPARASPSPVVTPVTPEPEDDGLDHEEEREMGGGDDASDAGTYTIESDSKEVQDAREQIDEVFGVENTGEGEEKVLSDDDTDKDVGDEEMEEEDEGEVYGGKPNGRGGVGGPGMRVRGDGSSRTAVNKIEDVERKLQGGPGTPQWVHQWATMATNSAPVITSPDRQPPQQHMVSPDHQRSPDRNTLSPDIHITLDGSFEAERGDHLTKKPPLSSRTQSTPKPAPVQSPDSASPRGSRGKRILPSTPAEKVHSTRQQSSASSGSEQQTMRQNGFQASNSSAFHSPRNHVTQHHQQQQQQRQQDPQYLRAMEEEAAFGTRRKLHGSSDPIIPPGLAQNEGRRDSWGPEGSMDTDVLLKDTETLMRNLEERMRTKRQETPSPEMSDSHDMTLDLSQDMSAISFEADIDTDVDNTSNISLAAGNHTWGGTKSRHYSCPDDNSASEQLHYSNGRQKTTRSTEKTKPAQSESHSRTSTSKSSSAEKGGIWSRLSTPNKHKVQQLEKDPDTVSDSEHSFRRNTHLTGSLPAGRVTNRQPAKGVSDTQKAAKKPRSLKAPSISQPRQTRSTMLRKNRFSEDSGADHSDISPSSSMSDLSSSKNLRRTGSLRETRSGAVSDSGRRTAGDRGRGRTSASAARNGESSTRADHSLGSQIVRHARTQSAQDQKVKPREASSRLPTAGSHSRTAGNLSRKSSIGSTDSNVSGVRKTNTGAWRRYDTADDSEQEVDNYIKNVHTRRTITQTQLEDRQAAAIQRQKSSSLQNLQSSGPQRGSPKKAPNLRVEIAQASNTLAQNLQRLAQGETMDQIQIDRIPKEQQVMDELLSEDSVQLGSRQDIWQGERRHPQVPLQRSSSLSFQPDQNSHGLLPGSPPIHIKKKQWNKSENRDQDYVSFDSLVLSSIHHLSIKMKDSSDKIAYKLKKLQQPGASEDELSKVLRDSEFPLLKTNNKEVAGILQNLRKMERRLEEIHNMVDPRNEIRLPDQLSPVNQMRRQYASEFSFSTQSDSEAPMTMTTRHVGRAAVNSNLARQRNAQQQQQQQHHPHQQSRHYADHGEGEEYYL